jgi:lysophospholipase L1-like esterase
MENKKNIFGFGDSIMKGVVIDPNLLKEGTIKYQVSHKSFASRCEESLSYPIHNMSRFGCTILSGLKFLERSFSEIHPNDMVALEFGGNDCNFNWKEVSERPQDDHIPNTPLQKFQETYRNIVDKILSVGAHPILLSLPALQSQMFFNFISRGLNKENILNNLGGDVNFINNWHECYNLEVFKLGKERHIPVINISTIFLRQRHLGDYYCIDGMHPNEAGHALITDAILNYQRQLALEC